MIIAQLAPVVLFSANIISLGEVGGAEMEEREGERKESFFWFSGTHHHNNNNKRSHTQKIKTCANFSRINRLQSPCCRAPFETAE